MGVTRSRESVMDSCENGRGEIQRAIGGLPVARQWLICGGECLSSRRR